MLKTSSSQAIFQASEVAGQPIQLQQMHRAVALAPLAGSHRVAANAPGQWHLALFGWVSNCIPRQMPDLDKLHKEACSRTPVLDSTRWLPLVTPWTQCLTTQDRSFGSLKQEVAWKAGAMPAAPQDLGIEGSPVISNKA